MLRALLPHVPEPHVSATEQPRPEQPERKTALARTLQIRIDPVGFLAAA